MKIMKDGRLTLQLTDEISDAILKDNLAWHYHQLQRDLNLLHETDLCYIFSKDPKEEKRQIKKHIKAFKLVCEYMGALGDDL